jgi:hypothetical protein
LESQKTTYSDHDQSNETSD